MRKLATAAAVSLVLASGGAFGLGLGDIEMRSALNQPMNAEIRLSSIKPGELEGMIVQLASEDAFRRAGIERSQALVDLRFSVDASGDVPVIRVTSDRPIVEPFLNFLLEVDWPAGRMVREYTVLLDPPVFMTPNASARSGAGDTPARTGGDGSLVAPAPIERSGGAPADGGFDVELVGDDAEVADGTAVGGGSLATNAPPANGEVVPLDGLASPDASSSGRPSEASRGDVSLVDGTGGIVPLTDLAAPNTDAAARRRAAARAAADADFEVEMVGDASEVGDDVGGTGDAGDDGTVVSLEELAPDAAGGSDGAGSEDVTVATGDTLYEIAEGAASGDVSVQQMMLALLEANQGAFIDGNINLVRAGSILRVPRADEARRRQQALAVAEVGRQNDLWQEYRDNLRGGATTRVARADTGGSDADDADGAAASADGADEERVLSENARAILEDARREILEREELRIVAADGSTSGAANAGEAADGDPAARAGEIDRRLQLASEELASTRLEAQDLDEQAGELGSTAESLDNLVTLRQNEVAALEARLAEARQASGDDATGGAPADAGDAMSDAAMNAVGAANGAADGMADGMADGAAGATAAASGAAANARNALTDAGQSLGDVQLVGAVDATEAGEAGGAGGAGTGADAQGIAANRAGTGTDAASLAAASSDAPNESDAALPWYQALFADPARLAIAGVGGAALLGVIGTLLWRRRKRDDGAWDEDDVHFLDETDAAEFASHDDSKRVTPAVVGVGGAAIAAGAAATAGGDLRESAGDDARGALDEGAPSRREGVDMTGGAAAGDDTIVDETQVFAGGAALSSAAARGGPGGMGGADLGRDADDGLDNDDTISEADVYLAYGLHGQAEELLGRAVERDPRNPVYARKLLDTYHAQGNAEAFDRTAGDYHERFGGDGAPDWAGVASLGNDLRPGNALYAAAAGMGGHVAGEASFDDDFGVDAANGPAGDDGARDSGPSVSRSFGAGSPDRGNDDGFGDDETGPMDQSLDPAFAFDESDLEATGDFSAIADEVAAESDEGDEGVIEFTDFEPEPARPRADRPAAAQAMDGLDAPELSGFGELDLSPGATAANEKMPTDADLDIGLDGEFGDGLGDGLELGPDDGFGEFGDGLDGGLDGGSEGGSEGGSKNGSGGGLGNGLDEGLADGIGHAPVDGARGFSDDLTLDLDELSGELELDGTELLDGADDDLEMRDLTADDERSLAGAAAAAGTRGDGFDDASFGGFGADADEMDTMMDLAKAYIDMGDKDSASSALDEIVRSGTPDQVVEAETLLRKIS